MGTVPHGEPGYGRYGGTEYGRPGYDWRYGAPSYGDWGWGGAYTEPWYGREGGYGRGGYYGGYGREGYGTWGREGAYGGYGRGRFAGRGPRGYQRSDERIREDVCDRLTDHPDIDASDIDVRVDGGIVMLSGTVDERRDRRMAEDVAESVSGVRDVQNQLRARQAAPGRTGGTMAGTTGGTAIGRGQVRTTMEVVGQDGDRVGEVKEVRDDDFLVDRAMQRDLYVPFSAIQNIIGDRIMLNIPAGHVDNKGWASPELTGAPTAGTTRTP